MEKLHIDDNAIIELVSASHNPDGRDFDINVALSVAETILDSETATDREAMEGKSKELGLNYKNVPLKLRQLCLEKSTSSMYTSEREITLWQKEKAWNLGLLLGNIDDIIKSWIIQENHIFLYGGNDAKWVQEFTSKVMEVSSKTHSNIQLAYVGKNEMIRASIIKENKGRILTRPYHVWWFWTRLQSSFLSRINYLNATSPGGDECNDEIARGFKNLLACESESATIKGWALKGQKVIVSGNGAKMLRVMNEYQNWTKSMAPESFGEPFKDYYKMISSCSFNSHPYCALEHPTTLKETIENEKCPECSYHMQKYITFTCKHGDI
nr:uncharacterized protein LOC109174238 [Ipomoea trifida]